MGRKVMGGVDGGRPRFPIISLDPNFQNPLLWPPKMTDARSSPEGGIDPSRISGGRRWILQNHLVLGDFENCLRRDG